jgi:uncharacterized protein YjbJ (UPF0337 family)
VYSLRKAFLTEIGNVRNYLACDFDSDAVGGAADMGPQQELGLWPERRDWVGFAHPGHSAVDGTPAFLMRHELQQRSLRNVSQHTLGIGVIIMSGTIDIVKGRIKEAAGALTNNDKLRQAGKTDQRVGQAKQAAQKGIKEAEGTVKKSVDAAKEVVQRAVDTAENAANANRK